MSTGAAVITGATVWEDNNCLIHLRGFGWYCEEYNYVIKGYVPLIIN